MDIFRIRGTLVTKGALDPTNTFELVAGLTPTSHIAFGPWYGTVREGDGFSPFVLDNDGHCQYDGAQTAIRYFSIVKRPVVYGEIFELTWENSEDRYCYKIDSVAQLS